MSKTAKILIIVAAAVSVLVGGTVAFAASGNLGTLENSWLNFHEDWNKELVAKGDLTQEEADEHLDRMRERFENSEEDDVYNRFKQRGFGNKNGRGGGIIEDYAQISGKEPSEILDALKDGDMNIWELAEKDGKFTQLKAAVLKNIDERIAELEENEHLERLKEHRAEIVAMKSAEDAPERPQQRAGFGKRFGKDND